MAFTATLADLSVDTFTPELQEGFKTAIRASLNPNVTASIALSGFTSGSVAFKVVVELLTGSQTDAAVLAANVAVRVGAIYYIYTSSLLS